MVKRLLIHVPFTKGENVAASCRCGPRLAAGVPLATQPGEPDPRAGSKSSCPTLVGPGENPGTLHLQCRSDMVQWAHIGIPLYSRPPLSMGNKFQDAQRVLQPRTAPAPVRAVCPAHTRLFHVPEALYGFSLAHPSCQHQHACPLGPLLNESRVT